MSEIKIRQKFPDVEGLDVELISLVKQIQDVADNIIIIGAKSATIGTVGTTAVYERVLTINGTVITVITSD